MGDFQLKPRPPVLAWWAEQRMGCLGVALNQRGCQSMSWPGEGVGRWPISSSLQAPFVRKVSSSLSRGLSRERQGVPLTHSLSCSSDCVHQQVEGRDKPSRGSWQENKEAAAGCLGLSQKWKALLAPPHGSHFGMPTLCSSITIIIYHLFMYSHS